MLNSCSQNSDILIAARYRGNAHAQSSNMTSLNVNYKSRYIKYEFSLISVSYITNIILLL